MRDGCGEDFTLSILRKNYEQTSLSSLTIEKYDVYFKRYIQTYVKENLRLYTSMREFNP
jgi:hypothetical protein